MRGVNFFRYRKVFELTDTDLDQLEDLYFTLKASDCLPPSSVSLTEFWREVRKIGGGKYALLSNLAMCLALVPHSNAVAERSFSMINHILAPSRKCLSKEDTLNNIMLVKCSNLPDDFMPSTDLQKKAKAATRLSLL